MTRLGLLLLGCAACWGEGPTPEVPSGVDIVLHVPHEERSGSNCIAGNYIGDVAIADDTLNVVFFQFSNCGPTGSRYNVDGLRIRLADGDRLDFTAGMTNTNASAKLATSMGRSAWVFNPNLESTNVIEVLGEPTLDVGLDFGGIGGAYLPTGVVADATHVFVMATSGQSNIDFNNPDWPCCGGGPTGQTGGVGYRIDWSVTPATSTRITSLDNLADVPYSESNKTSLVASSTSLFYAVRPSPGTTLIKTMPKDLLTAGVERATINSSKDMLVGFDANETTLFWATSPKYTVYPVPTPSCTISKVDVTGANSAMLFSTNDYFCSDLELDDTHVYFTIVSVPESDGNDGQSQPRSRGVGFGRVALGNPPTVETIRTGIDSEGAGPRRIYIDRDNLYAVDPFIIVRLHKSTFVGSEDF